VAEPTSESSRGDRSIGQEKADQYVNALGDLGSIERVGLFGGGYRRLFKAQLVSSFGDWVGFLAVAALAAKVGKSNADVAVGVVLSGRLIPGFFFGAFATALLDRWDRKKVMVFCDIGRGLIVALLPFVHSIIGLFLLSVLLELLTLMWTPAKEASVPNLVRPDQLAAANSASMGAAYGTIVPAVLLFPALTFIAALLHNVSWLHFLNQESLAIDLDVATFFASAFLISRMTLPQKTPEQKAAVAAATLASMWREGKEGWKFIRSTYQVRAVIIGFCTGLIGGGMVVPLGITYSSTILHEGATGFGLLELALGVGVAAGVMLFAATQNRLPHHRMYAVSVLGAGIALLLAACMSNIGLVMLCIGVFGMFVGAVYVLGFTILGASTSDELRGRIFGVFYTLVRLCLLLAFTLAPLLAGLLDGVSAHFRVRIGKVLVRHEVGTSSLHVALPGARLTLWLGGLIIVFASWIAHRDLRRA